MRSVTSLKAKKRLRPIYGRGVVGDWKSCFTLELNERFEKRDLELILLVWYDHVSKSRRRIKTRSTG